MTSDPPGRRGDRRADIAAPPGIVADTAPPNGDPSTRALSVGALVLGAQVVKLGLRLGGTVLLARLLTPADFGLVTMVATITGAIALFADLGLPQAIVQRAQITQSQISTLFWLNLGFGLVLMLAVILAAPLIAWLYGDPRLTGIARIGAPVFLATGVMAQYWALLLRDLRYRTLNAIDALALALSLLVALGLAALGFGYWSLASMPVIQVSFQLAALAAVSGWRPSRPVRGCGVRPLLHFGGNLLWVTLFNYLSRQIDKIGIGIVHGPLNLGYYTTGYQLYMLPTSQILTPLHDVIVSTLSRLSESPTRFLRTFSHLLLALTWLCAILAAAVWAWAPQIVGLTLGPRWEPAAAVLGILAPALAIQPLLSATGWAFVSRGEGRRYRRWALGTAGIQGLAILAGLPLGISAVAWASTLSGWCLTLPWTLYCLRQADGELGQAALRAVRWPLLAVAATLALAAGIGRLP